MSISAYSMMTLGAVTLTASLSKVVSHATFINIKTKGFTAGIKQIFQISHIKMTKTTRGTFITIKT